MTTTTVRPTMPANPAAHLRPSRRTPGPTSTAIDWKAQRKTRGWTQLKVLHLLRTTADQLGTPLDATPASLKTQLSRWENGATISPFYTDLLHKVFDLPTPTGPTAHHRRYRCGNSGVYRRILGTTPAAYR